MKNKTLTRSPTLPLMEEVSFIRFLKLESLISIVGFPGKATSVPVMINIEYVNDNPPVFEQNQYRRLIQNRAIDFDPPLVVKVAS